MLHIYIKSYILGRVLASVPFTPELRESTVLSRFKRASFFKSPKLYWIHSFILRLDVNRFYCERLRGVKIQEKGKSGSDKVNVSEWVSSVVSAGQYGVRADL